MSLSSNTSPSSLCKGEHRLRGLAKGPVEHDHTLLTISDFTIKNDHTGVLITVYLTSSFSPRDERVTHAFINQLAK